MPTSLSTISRLLLSHPDFGYIATGDDLFQYIRSLYTKLGDNINSRFFTANALAAAASIDFTHNFKCAFADLRYEVFSRNTTTGELTRLGTGTTPTLAQITVVAKTGLTTTAITVTNTSGSSVDLALSLVHDPASQITSRVETFLNKTLAAAVIQDFFDLTAVATPGSNPAAGKFRSYVKSDGKRYLLSPAGVETPDGGGLSPSYKAANFTAAAGFKYLVNSTGGPINAQMPAGSAFAQLAFADDAGTWDGASTNVTLTPATGERFQGLAINETLVLDVRYGWIELNWDPTNSYWVYSMPGYAAAVGPTTDASVSTSGFVNTAQQSFGGRKKFEGGMADVVNIQASSSTTVTLTDADRREQVFNPTATHDVVLPTTGILAGEIWILHNRATGFDITVKASGGQELSTANSTNIGGSIRDGRVRLVALQAAPTLAAHWRVIDVYENFEFTGNLAGASTAVYVLQLKRQNNFVFGNIRSGTATATANTTIAANAAYPVRFRPVTPFRLITNVLDNNALVSGLLEVDVGGNLGFTKVGLANFTGTCGVSASSSILNSFCFSIQ